MRHCSVVKSSVAVNWPKGAAPSRYCGMKTTLVANSPGPSLRQCPAVCTRLSEPATTELPEHW